MDGVAWMELVDNGFLELPPRTILCVVTRSKGDSTKTVYFDDFARALQYYGGMAKNASIIEAYVTAFVLKDEEHLTTLNLLNGNGFVQEAVPLLNWRAND